MRNATPAMGGDRLLDNQHTGYHGTTTKRLELPCFAHLCSPPWRPASRRQGPPPVRFMSGPRQRTSRAAKAGEECEASAARFLTLGDLFGIGRVGSASSALGRRSELSETQRAACQRSPAESSLPEEPRG
ncbi:hypothetical protein SKAU_G00343650 [Synaphobranchus kaupii]|uniref:Uncharacterized protein n=1 Tax=Synaphobranchus kaupii TaxID=118154 RepID=A0A9Q1EJ30_SYNKA|nr:hypothetical protein SKAU_G00343650 [Synaphobranchus kaupii]